MPDRGRLLELALKGLQAERAKIDDEIAEIKSQLMPANTVSQKAAEAGNALTATNPKKKRTMSAAARKKISESMKRRYAEKKKAAKKSA